MTNKGKASCFMLDDLRSVTNELNTKEVMIPDMIFTYRTFDGRPDLSSKEEQFVDLAEIVGEFAVLWQNDLVYVLKGSYERFLAVKMGVSYAEMSYPNEDTYEKYFKIVKHTKIAETFYKKDILYVYDNNNLLVITDAGLAQKFRAIRGNG